MTVSLRRALLFLLTAALAVALVPAGLALDRQLRGVLERRARRDLAMAPKVLADRNANRAEALRMHAEALAETRGLAEALRDRDRSEALRLVEGARDTLMEAVVLVDAAGRVLTGPADGDLAPPRPGEGGSVGFVFAGGELHSVALAPVGSASGTAGAAGVSVALDRTTADVLAGLTRSEVAILDREGRTLAATSAFPAAEAPADSLSSWRDDGSVHELTGAGGRSYWAIVAPVGDAGAVAFARSVESELAALPGLRRSAAGAGLLALILALVIGLSAGSAVARPVRALASASRRLADGDFDAPVPASSIREIEQVREAFVEMRETLRAKLAELTSANEELAERQERLQALQAELIQRDRLASAGRLVTELAHEIRNPVAGVRNSLELIRRELDDPELQEFADMAVDELLRMHELAEQMLDLNRPGDPDVRSSDPAAVARQVATLMEAGEQEDGARLAVTGEDDLTATIPPDSLKQVLLNLVQNAREAMEGEPGEPGRVEIRVKRRNGGVVVDVLDTGPGMPEEVLPRVFDPFFTTKGAVHGVGLGLFVAEGVVRRHGGRITASNRDEGGARFRIELPAGDGAEREPAGEADEGDAGEPDAGGEDRGGEHRGGEDAGENGAGAAGAEEPTRESGRET